MHETTILLKLRRDDILVDELGDEEGLCSGVGVEALDMEVRGRSDEERSLLHSVRGLRRRTVILEAGHDQSKARDLRECTYPYGRCTHLQAPGTLLAS